MATSSVATAAEAGVAAMPLLTCGVNDSRGGQPPNQADRPIRPFPWSRSPCLSSTHSEVKLLHFWKEGA